jgi:hypothetical protein
VRRIITAASVKGYLRDKNYKFIQETQEYPTFGANLLQEIRSALDGLKVTKREARLKDPINGAEISINSASDS